MEKSNIIIFLPKGQKYNTHNLKININGKEIKHVNFTKCLGIYIDENLSWAQHAEYLSKKIARNVGVGILSQLKHFIPMYIMNTLYHYLIYSIVHCYGLIHIAPAVTSVGYYRKKLYEL